MVKKAHQGINLLIQSGLLMFALVHPAGLLAAESTLTFGVVPQQAASKLAQHWGPLLQYLARQTGHRLLFKTATDIPTFERRLAAGEYDLAYMNPYHYTIFNKQPGYKAFAHALNKRIAGIVVTHKDAPYKTLEDLADETLAFPSPAAFAASIIVQQEFRKRNIPIDAAYVSSHDSVYRTVAMGIYPAGGGVLRTYNAVSEEVRQQLRILWTTPGYTPHAIAAHPRVSGAVVEDIRAALIGMSTNEAGRQLLEPLKMEGWQAANDSEWDEVRDLDLHFLDHLIEE
jgi:phosphonate transport system substrate-binding protein